MDEPQKKPRGKTRKYKTEDEAYAAALARRRERYATDPAYRSKLLTKQKERYATNPVFRAKQIAAAKVQVKRMREEAKLYRQMKQSGLDSTSTGNA
jgi:hypothetical protein